MIRLEERTDYQDIVRAYKDGRRIDAGLALRIVEVVDSEARAAIRDAAEDMRDRAAACVNGAPRVWISVLPLPGDDDA